MTNFKPGVALAGDHAILRSGLTDHCRPMMVLNERELEFMRLVCTEWTYKEIADRMYLSPRTIDGYRDALFEKLNVRTRVGLAMFAVRNGIVDIDPAPITQYREGRDVLLARRKPRSVPRMAER
jgi:DNA-binding CsgD family transcriptional regulator